MSLYQIFHPPVFQGNSRKKQYFEGWYYKQVSHDYNKTLAIIPGISLGEDPHAFIQLIDGKTGVSHYVSYPVGSFSADAKTLDIQIGENRFTQQSVQLNISTKDVQANGKLNYQHQVNWPVSIFRPGIMGWYRYMPFMECYHGVVGVNQTVHGNISLNQEEYVFTEGFGYIEKDWGRSFPEQWIWLHANCFENRDTVLMMSIAKIPWMGRYFIGFLAFVYHQGKFYNFFTYNRSKIRSIEQDEKQCELIFGNVKYQLHINAKQKGAGKLKAPVLGKMDRMIKESVDSEVHFTLKKTKGEIIYTGISHQAGLEIFGDLVSLI